MEKSAATCTTQLGVGTPVWVVASEARPKSRTGQATITEVTAADTFTVKFAGPALPMPGEEDSPDTIEGVQKSDLRMPSSFQPFS